MTAEILSAQNREDLTIAMAAVALHGLIASGAAVQATGIGINPSMVVRSAFELAREFLRQAEQL